MITPGGRRAEPSFDRGQTQHVAGLTPEDMPVHAGDVIAARYRVEGVIGVGGMGIVVSGVHLDLEQRVAIKLILPSAMNNEGLRERFVREARAAARLRSEHVTKVLDVGKLPSGAPYMVMELLEGCDLGEVLAKNGPLPYETAADFIAQACEAVAEAHAQGIVHRDIKPQNLFLTTCVGGGALVKVLDFGVSKVSVAGMDNLTRSMMVMGSPVYMSPEQMRSARDVDPRTDIWALGVVLFELLTGRAPFDAESIPALCLKVAAEAPPSLARERPDLPAGLAAVVMRCLEKHPEDRFPNVGELAAALTPFVTPASNLTIARTRMMMSGLRRGGWSASDAPVVGAAPAERRAGGATVAALFVGLFVCATIVGAATWWRGRGDAIRPAKAGAPVSSIAPPAEAAPPPTTPPAPPPPVPSAPPLEAAPSASTSAAPPATAATAVRPRLPRRPLAHPPPPPVSKDDDIPSMR